MELGAGGTLGEFLHRHNAYISEEHLVCWLGQMLRGLACMHKGGVLHRDIKPSNVLVRRRGASAWDSDVELFFADFGIAAVVPNVNCETERTVMGSGAYCPPEIAQYWGYRSRCPYSYASDMWSTAAIFYVQLTCGAARVDEGMGAVFLNSIAALSADDAAAAQLRVARGDYPPLSMLLKIPLMDDKSLYLSLQSLVSRRAGQTSSGEADYTRYTTIADNKVETHETDAGQWPAWAFTPGTQLMARNLRARELSLEFLHLLDAMMAPNPGDRPTAEKVLLESPLFAMRMPWWEKAVEATVQRIMEGKENALLDVCVCDSDEEEEEDEEEIAVMRRTMTPLVMPAENNGYVPHNVIHWWYVDLTKGEPDHTKWLPPSSLLCSLLTMLRRMTAPKATTATDTEDGPRVTLYTATGLQFIERVFVPLQDTEITPEKRHDGPLLRELEARGLDTNSCVHVQIRLHANAGAKMVFLQSDDADEAEVVDEEEMARCVMEKLLSATEAWLRYRVAMPAEAALHVLPWVSWHLSEASAGADGSTQRSFFLEYVATAMMLRREDAPHCGIRITGEISGVFREWRANLDDALRNSLRRTAAPAANGVEGDKPMNVRHRSAVLSKCLEEALDALDDAELELQEEQRQEETHLGLLQGHVVHWMCVKSVPSVEECMSLLSGTIEGAGTLSMHVEKWISSAIFTTEGTAALTPCSLLEGGARSFHPRSVIFL
ncbi:putative serine/threonine protein kinase [Trypanosoma grayi]|uniref:putative serine/threonine protein kinase n=1 Tax=Trypanosoma grayi TaxID=71804 RepID=UPI0004F44F4C|nr:putative serine/threonine protein kinase [Trypanosoma grayi]KEG06449.1 putative serine/threonine protein kinase [Trypanosoma grayi]